DQKAAPAVDIPIAHCCQQQTGLRLSAFANDCIGRMLSVRMMRAIVESIDTRITDSQVLCHPTMKISDGLLTVIAVGYAGLIGDHNHKTPPFIVFFVPRLPPPHPPKLAPPMHITAIPIEHTVAVEKYCRPGNGLHQQKPSSMRPQRIWPTVMWSCWI